MHRFRINLCGSDAAVERASRELEEAGALPIGPREPSCWVWSCDDGWDDVAALSRRHPGLPMSVEGFQDFHDEIGSAMVLDGEASLESTRGLLPDGWGSFHEEDGRSLDHELLAWAGALIAQRPAEPSSSTLFSGLETALAMGEELGRFVEDARDFLALDAPTETTLDAVARLAQTALSVSAAARSRTRGELAYLLPLRLTQAVVHAGHDDYEETPGHADWHRWLGLLLGGLSELIDDAHLCDVFPVGPDPALSPGCDRRDPGEAMELSARALVTSCVQTLALFGARDR